jgi:hypothetical protein
VNARVFTVSQAKQPVFFFDQGLLPFLRDFAALASWAAPELPPQDFTDAALAAIPHRHTMPLQASKLFTSSLGSYVVEGNPGTGSPRVPRPAGNPFLMEILFLWMMKFVFLHEFAHIELGHLGKQDTNGEASRRCEYDADAFAAWILTELSKRTDTWALAFWACDLTLIAFNLLDRALALFEFGGKKINWISETHPDPIERRRALHASVSPEVSDRARKAGGNLVAMDKALFQRLWEVASPEFLLAHSHGVRPSPLWSKRIKRSMEPAL